MPARLVILTAMAEIHSVEGLAEYAHQQIERIERMQQLLTAQTGTGTSRQGLVTASTGPSGMLRDLEINPDAMRLSPAELTAEIKSAITAAQSDYATKADDIMGPILGVRPSQDAQEALEAGMSRLDELSADLDRIARERGIDLR
jgi:DNA-binding protein YbaB